jgi:hypothetical protein
MGGKPSDCWGKARRPPRISPRSARPADGGSSLPAEGRLTRVRVPAIHSPNQLGEAAPELEVSLGEGATLPGLLGTLRRSPVGGHQFGQVGSGGPHAGRKRRIAIRALRPELRLANWSRNAHLTLRQSLKGLQMGFDSATGTITPGTARWCARGHQRAPERPGWQGINLPSLALLRPRAGTRRAASLHELPE